VTPLGGVRPSWQLDERDHAGPEHLDAGYVAGYDAKAGVDAAEEVELLRRHGLGVETTLVDLGAGTGLIAVSAAPFAHRVVAVDPSPSMLDAAQRRAAEERIENVDFVEAGFLTYGHQGQKPQLVHSRNALHHLPDFWKGIALARVRELLAPGGTFVLRDLVYSFEPNEADERVAEWLAAASSSPAEGWTRAELEEHIRAENSTFSWLFEVLLEHAGFAIRETAHSSGVYATYICTAA
jgi:SAM-dependent methyltransferase